MQKFFLVEVLKMLDESVLDEKRVRCPLLRAKNRIQSAEWQPSFTKFSFRV
jgi:hypothetical protein